MKSNTSQLSNNPFPDAEIAWHMATATASENYPLDLAVCGKARIGETLTPEEYAESARRGGDGHVSVLEGGWLALDTYRARRFRPVDSVLSLYVRAWVGPNGTGGLFFSDFLALTIGTNGLAIGFLGARTPAGKVFRELPLGIVPRGQWLDLVLRIGNGDIAFFCNGEQICSIPLHHGLCAPFDDCLLIGAWKCSKPDLYGTSTPRGFADCKIDTVALWHRALSDGQIAFLSGVERLEKPVAPNTLAQAFLDYNAFFDASVNKDIEACERLWKALRNVAAQDPARPTYHLTQPLGEIFDPCGAYYFGGKYHVFSYRNIFRLLEYSSLDHYVSDDLLHWTEWPVGPWADGPHDVFCIYLMNHFIDDQGNPRALYTGQGTGGKFGVLARSDDGLVSYTDKKPVLTKYHHDGHVWKDGDTWFTITSRRCKGLRPGALGDPVMLWSSMDLEYWQERGEIFSQVKNENGVSGGDRTGFMEFPYLLPFGDRHVLILGGWPVRYWVGRFDRKSVKFIADKPDGKLLDYSSPFHCYNPLCVDQKGPGGIPRRIVMAVYPSGNAVVEPGQLPWGNVHAMPRSLELDGDHLRQEPVAELESLRGERESYHNITVMPDTSSHISKRGDALEIIAEFEPGDATYFGLKVRTSKDGSSFARIYFNAITGEYGVDGEVAHPGFGPSYIPKGKPVQMHVFLDKLLLETFVNGQTCTTTAKVKDLNCDGIDLFSEGGSARCTRLDIWNMKSANE